VGVGVGVGVAVDVDVGVGVDVGTTPSHLGTIHPHMQSHHLTASYTLLLVLHRPCTAFVQTWCIPSPPNFVSHPQPLKCPSPPFLCPLLESRAVLSRLKSLHILSSQLYFTSSTPKIPQPPLLKPSTRV